MFISPTMLELLELLEPDDGSSAVDASAENLSPSLIGRAVDYLTRLTRLRASSSGELANAVIATSDISLSGAEIIQSARPASAALRRSAIALADLNVAEEAEDQWRVLLDETSAKAACLLCSFDVGFHAGPAMWDPLKPAVPDGPTIHHIIAMVEHAQGYGHS